IESLKEVGRAPAGLARNRLRRFLIASEIAVSFVLLVGAGLMIRSLVQLHSVSPGFDPNHVLTFEISPAGWRSVERANFVAQYCQRLSALTGVESVGAISHLPFDDYPNWYSPYGPEGLTEDQRKSLLADYRAVTPEYFQAIGARLMDGRPFSQLDSATSQNVVIVDEMLSRQTWPNESALGKRLDVEEFVDGDFVPKQALVVGVVEHIKGHSLLKAVRGQIYIPYTQSSREHLSFVVRSAGDPVALAGPIKDELSKLDKTRAIAKVGPMDQYVAMAMAPTRFTAVLAGIFAGLALLLATVGLYGVISYSVNQRKHEMGVRMALGARSADILRVVFREGLSLTAIGL